MLPVVWGTVAVNLVRLIPGVSLFDGHRLAQLGLLTWSGLVVVCFPGLLQAGWRLLAGWVRLLLAAILGLALTSALRAPLPMVALVEVTHLAALGVTAVALASVRRDRLLSHVILAAVVTALAVLVLTGALWWMNPVPFKRLYLGSTVLFAHPRHLNQIQVWTLPFVVLGGVRARRARARWAYVTVAILWGGLLMVMEGRGAILGVVLGVATVALVSAPGVRRWVSYAGLVLVASSLLYGASRLLDDSTSRWTSGGDVTSGRVELWAYAVSLARQHPWLGAGPMHYAYQSPVLSAHPHNQVLQWASEVGLPATAMLSVLGLAACLAVLRAVRAYDRERAEAGAAIACAVVGAAFLGMLDGVFVMPLSQMWGALVVATAMAHALPPREAPEQFPFRQTTCVRVALLAALGVMWLGVAPMVWKLENRASAMSAGIYGRSGERLPWLPPRFWQAGFTGPEDGR